MGQQKPENKPENKLGLQLSPTGSRMEKSEGGGRAPGNMKANEGIWARTYFVKGSH